MVAAHETICRRASENHLRFVASVNVETVFARCELDSHADTCALGRNFVPLAYTGRVCDVSPYNPNSKPEKNVPIITGATAFTSHENGETYILVINEGLWLGATMSHSLINPNQLRYHGLTVQDNPFDNKNPIAIECLEDTIFPLSIEGTVIFLETRTPTQRELDTCTHIQLTSDNDWNPQSVRLLASAQTAEAEVNYDYGDDLEPGLSQISCVYDFAEMAKSLARNCQEQRTVTAAAVKTDLPGHKTFISKKRHSEVTPEQLSERWNIGLAQAKQTIKVTTQRGVRSAILPLSRRYRTDRMYNQRKLRGQRFYTDTVIGKYKSVTNNTCAQLFANESFFAKAYPMERKSFAGAALRQFIRDYGVPEQLTFDGAAEQVKPKTEFMKNVRKYEIDYHIIEPHRPQQNRAETVIREVKKRWFRQMVKRKVPKRLWDYGIVWACEIISLTSNSAFSLDGRTPMEQITGETPDISEYLDFSFYDWVWYKDNAGLSENKTGRWLGVSHRVGNLMSYWILTITGRVISRTTVQRVTNLEHATDEVKQRCIEYDKRVNELLKDANHIIPQGDDIQLQDWNDYPIEDDPDFVDEFQNDVSDENVSDEEENFTPDVFDDTYLHMEVALPRGRGDIEDVQFAKVTKRLRDAQGRPIGTAHDNPLLDTREYEVEFLDGHKESLSANLIAQHLFSQVDDEGHRHVLLDEIIDYKTDDTAIDKADAFVTMSNGVQKRRSTTQGWKLLCQWKDGSTNWVALKDMKNSYPVQVADFAKANRIEDEPAFAWWVPFTLKKRDRILSKVKSKYWIRTHKFGIRIPKSVGEAQAIDAENGDTLWWDAIVKEMKNVRPAFEIWEKPESGLPVGYQKIKCHFIYDIKMGENFRRKARLVANGNETETPPTLTYSSVVSRDSVRIALTIAALNDLKLLSCDIQNAYLTADCREKIYIRAGPEFGSEMGAVMVIKKALYGLKSSGAAFRSHLAETLFDLNYTPTKGDPDVWIRPGIKPDGFEYYEMMLVYVDDVLCVSHDPHPTMKGIQGTFKLKDDKIEEPESYLGAQLAQKMIGGTKCWTMSSEQYVKAAVANVETKLDKTGQRLPTRCFTPLKSAYRPELDVTAELKIDGIRYYQELIGVLRWAIELGRIDIAIEVSMLSTHLAMPREGHLQAAYHVFAYLKVKPKRTLAFDPQHPDIDEARFTKCDWHDFYRGAKEPIPGDAPEPRGNVVSTHCFVDADHAGNRVTRRSQTGILLFLNRAPIIWYSKRQNTVETSTFGSEFVALRIAVELTEALRYKLRMFGIPIEGPTNVYCDNEAVTKNAIHPESTLKKKHNSIAYHRAREAVAAGTIRVTKEDGKTNLADVLTKLLPQVTKEGLCDKFMY